MSGRKRWLDDTAPAPLPQTTCHYQAPYLKDSDTRVQTPLDGVSYVSHRMGQMRQMRQLRPAFTGSFGSKKLRLLDISVHHLFSEGGSRVAWGGDT
jgi:hypothetical protein